MSINLEHLRVGFTFITLGDLIIAYVALSVHQHILKERSIDEDVLQYMKKERYVGLVGILFIVTGFILEMMGI